VPSANGDTRAPLVFVDDLSAPDLDPDDRHHLERVLRVRPGDRIVVADGAGAWRPCRFGPGGSVAPVGQVEVDAAPDPVLTVAFAVTKAERPEVVVQKLTELGVDRILPFVAERSVARWEGERARRHVERLRKIARQASMQCRRARLPLVGEVARFDAVASLPGAALADAGGPGPSLDHPVVLIGPEGGWSDAERGYGLPTVSLGQHVLRAETAAITTGALLGALRMNLVGRTSPFDTD
jgi:16S rRNA (uracil1498-N3)-methyltransferase